MSDVRVRLASAVAGMLEWYDFSIFGFMAVEIGANFFSENDDESGDSLIASLGVFGGAFIARPLGGILFGQIGDVGCGKVRKDESLEVRRLRALEGSLLVMAVPATALALLPTRATIGMAAPLLMLAVRVLQGLSVGGQLTGALLSAAEKSPTGRELGTTATLMAACNSGTLLGAAVSFVCHAAFTDAQLLAWAWRVPFAMGAVLSLVAYGVVRAVRPQSGSRPPSSCARRPAASTSLSVSVGAAADDDAPSPSSSQPAAASGASPLRLVLGCAGGRRKVLAAVCAWGLHTATFYTTFMFLPLYFVQFLKLPTAPAHGLTSVCLLLACVLVPLAGRRADVLVRRRLDARHGTARLAMSVLTPPRLHIHSSPAAGWTAALLAAALLLLHHVAIDALVGAWLLSVFAPEVRYSAVALSVNVATMLFAGPAPALEAALADIDPGYRWTAGLFVSVAAMSAALCTRLGEDPLDERRSLLVGTRSPPSESDAHVVECAAMRPQAHPSTVFF